MTHDDVDELHIALKELFQLEDRQLTEDMTFVWFKALEPYPIGVVNAAIMQHIRDPENGKYKAKPAHIIEKIKNRMRQHWLPVDQAWPVAVRSFDERNTVLMDSETAMAAAAARPLYVDGDDIGAHLTFKDVYQREVNHAIDIGRAPTKFLSQGSDANQRSSVAQELIAFGQLDQAQAKHYIGHDQAVSGDGAVLLQLIRPSEGAKTDQSTIQPSEIAKSHVNNIRQIIKAAAQNRPMKGIDEYQKELSERLTHDQVR